MPKYQVGEKIQFTHFVWALDYVGEPTIINGIVTESATVTRVAPTWFTLEVDSSGEKFSRQYDSPSVTK